MASLPLIKLFVILLCSAILGCSATQSDVRQQKAEQLPKNVKMAILGGGLTTSSQEGGKLYILHHSPLQVLAIAKEVALLYGFELVDEQDAEYLIELNKATPDGGACVSGLEAAEFNVSYSLSLLTLGAFPATNVHCVVIEAGLFKQANPERELMAEFLSNAGEIEVYAGVNDLKSYQRTVKPEDEAKALELSLGALYAEMIREGAFDF